MPPLAGFRGGADAKLFGQTCSSAPLSTRIRASRPLGALTAKYPECIFVWRRRLNLMHCCNCLNCCSWRFAPLVLFCENVSDMFQNPLLDSVLSHDCTSACRLGGRIGWRSKIQLTDHWGPRASTRRGSCTRKTPQPTLMISQWPEKTVLAHNANLERRRWYARWSRCQRCAGYGRCWSNAIDLFLMSLVVHGRSKLVQERKRTNHGPLLHLFM